MCQVSVGLAFLSLLILSACSAPVVPAPPKPVYFHMISNESHFLYRGVVIVSYDRRAQSWETQYRL